MGLEVLLWYKTASRMLRISLQWASSDMPKTLVSNTSRQGLRNSPQNSQKLWFKYQHRLKTASTWRGLIGHDAILKWLWKHNKEQLPLIKRKGWPWRFCRVRCQWWGKITAKCLRVIFYPTVPFLFCFSGCRLSLLNFVFWSYLPLAQFTWSLHPAYFMNLPKRMPPTFLQR